MAATRKLQMHPGTTVFKPAKSRRDRTLELGPARLAKAEAAIRSLEQLANPQTHELRGDEPKKLVAKLQERVDALRYAFEHPGKPATTAGVFQTDS